MTVSEFQQIGGSVTMLRRDPPETRWLAELPQPNGTTIRRRGPSALVAIAGVLSARDGATGAAGQVA